MQLISEVGTDMSRWLTEKHFTFRLGRAGGRRQSGKSKGLYSSPLTQTDWRFMGGRSRGIPNLFDKQAGSLLTSAMSTALLEPQTRVPAAPPAKGLTQRLVSIDAYRGLVMFLMMAEVLKFWRVHEALPNSAFWKFLAHHQSHAAWIGCSLHDLIQPSFSFLVGVALPFSLARRTAQGQPQWQRTLHAFWRALVLVLLGVFLRSIGSAHTRWTFEDTLSQIGLGYGFLYLLGL